MSVHIIKPLPERTGIDYYSRYFLILFLEDIIYLLDHNFNILNTISEGWETLINIRKK
jgi:hypothetical protein